MIECAECGTENDESAVFCQNPACGAFLEWSGSKKDASVTAATAQADGAEEGTTATTVANGTGPGPAKPGPELAAPPARVAAPEPPPGVGELVCQRCGAGNQPHLHFCRRCGAPLAHAPVVHPTRRQRVLRRGSPPGAGERPKWKRNEPRVRRDRLARGAVVGVAALAAAAVLTLGALLAWNAGANDAIPGAFGSARHTLFPRYEPVRPAADAASSARRRHPAHAAFDQDLNTFWATKLPGRGSGARLIVRFEPGTDLAQAQIFGGDPVAQQLVPETLQLAFFRRRARPARGWEIIEVRTVDLENKPGFQRRALNVDDVGRVVIIVRQTYRSDVPRASAALTEIEFFRRK